MKSLAVVVLNWNGLDDTRALLPTLARCRMPEDWALRVIVVDNGSTDGSIDALAAEFHDVELIALNENRRFARPYGSDLRRRRGTRRHTRGPDPGHKVTSPLGGEQPERWRRVSKLFERLDSQADPHQREHRPLQR